MAKRPLFLINTAGKSREQMKAEAREALAQAQQKGTLAAEAHEGADDD